MVYDLLFRAPAETTLTIAADPKPLGARVGFTHSVALRRLASPRRRPRVAPAGADGPAFAADRGGSAGRSVRHRRNDSLPRPKRCRLMIQMEPSQPGKARAYAWPSGIDFLHSTRATAWAGAVAPPAAGQGTAPAVATSGGAAQSAASIPDFSGLWAHPGLGFGPQLSGPGPIRNKSRLPSGASNFDQLVGDYSNPILKPEAAEAVKKLGEISPSAAAPFLTPTACASKSGAPYFLEFLCPTVATARQGHSRLCARQRSPHRAAEPAASK